VRVLLIGAPGAGKGTQAAHIARHFGLTHISSGDLLRQHVREATTIGRQVKEYIDRGDLVPDAIIMDMLYKPVMAATASGGYILDGFPRTVSQAETAYAVAGELGVQVQLAVHIAVQREELLRRLTERGRGADDDISVARYRLKVYDEKTLPLVDYYRERERLVEVNGGRPVDEVTWSIVVQLQRAKRKHLVD
jgi:adenylate kinase